MILDVGHVCGWLDNPPGKLQESGTVQGAACCALAMAPGILPAADLWTICFVVLHAAIMCHHAAQ
jgi:hypothetical protein